LIDYKHYIEIIHKVQLENFYPLNNFREDLNTMLLPRKNRGLYWIWSEESFENLRLVVTNPGTKQVPFHTLITQRKDLDYVCKPMIRKLRVVYNGKGGYRKRSKGFGLRERIFQELNCSDYRTGTLHLEHRNIDQSKWAISFFNFDCPQNQALLPELKNNNFYDDYAGALEVGWRLHYGAPILSRH